MELISNCTGVWEIYRDVKEGKALIYRMPKGSAKTSIEVFLGNHRIIQQLGLSSLVLLKQEEIGGRLFLVTEDINYGKERVYVSYNSVYSDQHREMDELSTAVFERSSVNKIMSPYEQYRYQHKLSEIKEFPQFIIQMKDILAHVSRQHVSIDFDTYFFGTDRGDVSNIDYKLIDLDHITKDENCIDLYAINVSEFKRAINGFIRNFVVAAEQKRYLDLVENG